MTDIRKDDVSTALEALFIAEGAVKARGNALLALRFAQCHARISDALAMDGVRG